MATTILPSPGNVATLPVSETANEHTEDIDVAPISDAVRMLAAADSQIFGGWKCHPGLADAEMHRRVALLSSAVVQGIREHGDAFKCILTGCGTSGRLAWRAAAQWNAVLQAHGFPAVLDYLLSGGDAALILSDELPEDDAATGIKELQEKVEHCTAFMLVGISCGLSAPYVAGQVHWAMGQAGGTVCMLGFNPQHLARDAPVEGFPFSVQQVVRELAEHSDGERCILLNPVIGPEPITGSTRMKGGSATKVLLDTMLAVAMDELTGATDSMCLSGVQQRLLAFQSVQSQVYFAAAAWRPLVQQAAAALKGGGHLYYIGSGAAGIMGLIDASEMPDTYGSPFDEVRGFVEGGWAAAAVHSPQQDMRAASKYCCIQPADFMDLPKQLKAGSLVVVCALGAAEVEGGAVAAAVANATEAGASVAYLNIATPAGKGQASSLSACADVPLLGAGHVFGASGPTYSEMALKWVLNAVSTLAQVGKGMVFKNKMVNVGVLNNKLFYRSQRLICEFAGVGAGAAQEALLRSIHDAEGPPLPPAVTEAAISDHIKAATGKPNVVPRAMLLASGFARDLLHADELLAGEPVLRTLLAKLQAPQHVWFTLSTMQQDSDAFFLAVQSLAVAVGGSALRLPGTGSARLALACTAGTVEASAAKVQHAIDDNDELRGVACCVSRGSQLLSVARPGAGASSGAVLYCVTGTTSDQALYSQFREWLVGGHVQELVRRASLSAVVVDHGEGGEGGARSLTSMYGFRDMQDYEAYVRDHAPALKAQSAALFKTAQGGISFHRDVFERMPQAE